MTDPTGLFDTKGKALIAVCYMPVIHPAHRALKPKTLLSLISRLLQLTEQINCKMIQILYFNTWLGDDEPRISAILPGIKQELRNIYTSSLNFLGKLEQKREGQIDPKVIEPGV